MGVLVYIIVAPIAFLALCVYNRLLSELNDYSEYIEEVPDLWVHEYNVKMAKIKARNE